MASLAWSDGSSRLSQVPELVNDGKYADQPRQSPHPTTVSIGLPLRGQGQPTESGPSTLNPLR